MIEVVLFICALAIILLMLTVYWHKQEIKNLNDALEEHQKIIRYLQQPDVQEKS